MPTDLAIWFNLSGSDYPCPQKISMILKMFELLRDACISVKLKFILIQICLVEQWIFVTEKRLFKYIENFTTKNLTFSDKNSDIFHISAQNIDLGTRISAQNIDLASARRLYRVPTIYVFEQK